MFGRQRIRGTSGVINVLQTQANTFVLMTGEQITISDSMQQKCQVGNARKATKSWHVLAVEFMRESISVRDQKLE
jgi:hypothetical protein